MAFEAPESLAQGQFTEGIKSLSSAPLPEKQKYQVILNSAKSTGATEKSILESLDFYKNLLEKEKENFST